MAGTQARQTRRPGEPDHLNERYAALALRQDKLNKAKAAPGKPGPAEFRQSRIDERLLRDNARASSEETEENAENDGAGADDGENPEQAEDDNSYAEPDNGAGGEDAYGKTLREKKIEEMQARQAEGDQAGDGYGEDATQEQAGSGDSMIKEQAKHFLLALVPGYEYWMILRGAFGQGKKSKVSLLNKIWIAINALVRSIYVLLIVGFIAIMAMIMEASWWELLKGFFTAVTETGLGVFEAIKLLF